MGLTFCSISFDTSSAVDSRETCQLLRSVPYLPKGLCSLARNVISLVRGRDFSRRYLGGGNRSPHPISFPCPSPAKAHCLFWPAIEVTRSSPCLLSRFGQTHRDAGAGPIQRGWVPGAGCRCEGLRSLFAGLSTSRCPLCENTSSIRELPVQRGGKDPFLPL